MSRRWSLAVAAASVCALSEGALNGGVNLQPSYYNSGEVTFGWELMDKYNATIRAVRIEIEPDKEGAAGAWIQEAAARGYSVVATYHKCSALGSDDPAELELAAQWWADHYANLKLYGDFTINLMNEWGSHYQTAESYSSAYNSALSLVRTVYEGDVIIDIPGWGQETHIAAQASPMIADDKIVFSAHVYPGGWNEAAGHCTLAADMDMLASAGRPCIIGEFGTIGDGPVVVSNVVARAKELGFWGPLGWAWNGDGGQMNMVSPAWFEDPTADSYSETPYFWEVFSLL